MTRASSSATSCWHRAASPSAMSASPCGRRCARSTRASPGRSSPSTACPRVTAHLFDYPTGADPRSSCTCPAASCGRSARSARTSAASSTTSPTLARWSAPATKATSTPHRRRAGRPPQRPLGRIDVEVRDGTVRALAARGEGEEATSMTTTDATSAAACPSHRPSPGAFLPRGPGRPRRVRRGAAVAAGVPAHRRRRRPARRRRRPGLGDRRAVGRVGRRARPPSTATCGDRSRAAAPPAPGPAIGGDMAAIVFGLARRLRLPALPNGTARRSCWACSRSSTGSSPSVHGVGGDGYRRAFVFPSLGPTARSCSSTPRCCATSSPQHDLGTPLIKAAAGYLALVLFGLTDDPGAGHQRTGAGSAPPRCRSG